MSKTVIKVENLSKQYRLGTVGTGTLSHDLNRFWAKVRGKEDPFLKIGDVNDRSSKGESDYVWALKDINFEVKEGEVLGIIGRNGSGKSTLLKILSQVTTPSKGNVKMRGRVGSLLEVGTGFHPELTGRENIYINGAILGMRKWEIDKKLDEIIDFAGVEKYIDTPVKRYSSGMTVRLGFSVAAHLEPEILIVDEVLAVGDAEFQKKCLGKMKNVSENDGRTILFVSHNMGSIQDICNECVVLDKGSIALKSNVGECIKFYMSPFSGGLTNKHINNQLKDLKKNPYMEIMSVYLGQEDQEDLSFRNDENIKITIQYKIKNPTIGLRLSLKLYSDQAIQIFRSSFDDGLETPMKLNEGVYNSSCVIPKNFLSDHNYILHIYPWIYKGEDIHTDPLVIHIRVDRGGDVNKAFPGDPLQGVISPLLDWKTSYADE